MERFGTLGFDRSWRTIHFKSQSKLHPHYPFLFFATDPDTLKLK
jgi:hypothetical protein